MGIALVGVMQQYRMEFPLTTCKGFYYNLFPISFINYKAMGKLS